MAIFWLLQAILSGHRRGGPGARRLPPGGGLWHFALIIGLTVVAFAPVRRSSR